MNQASLSLFIDCLGLKQRRITAANRPNKKPIEAAIKMDKNWKPPCLVGLSLKVGVLPFLPAVKIELNTPPNVEKMMPSIGNPFLRCYEKNF